MRKRIYCRIANKCAESRQREYSQTPNLHSPRCAGVVSLQGSSGFRVLERRKLMFASLPLVGFYDYRIVALSVPNAVLAAYAFLRHRWPVDTRAQRHTLDAAPRRF